MLGLEWAAYGRVLKPVARLDPATLKLDIRHLTLTRERKAEPKSSLAH
jgi:hypothetical protein